MGKSEVKFNYVRSVSNQDVDRLHRIPMMLRQQHGFTSARWNIGTYVFRKLGCQNGAFAECCNTSAAVLQSEMVGAKWVAMTVDCEWAVRNGGGGLVTEQLRLTVMMQVVTLLQLSYCAACSNNQHCLTLQTYFCTSVNTILLKCLTTIIAVTDGYTCFLSEPVWMSLQYPFVVRWGWRGLREDRGICSSVSTVRTVIAG